MSFSGMTEWPLQKYRRVAGDWVRWPWL